ncbi:hypothetical protein V8B55DRAFT_1382236 [Mucor lusitanicus]|uniref:Uncharacterized protein n=1 Tax=Mucor circinelloides f. lusitanicus TaxID=29924 RepID=A0A8H4BMD6_MUCCL|nr:hypothetical protein FB192DRAFT_1359241 [Mucor lusitanicus]
MTTLPFLKESEVPINCIPICPSFSQVLSVEKMRHSIQAKGVKNCTVKADALISEFDKFAFGEMSTSNTSLTPEKECLCGKMYFVVELLRLIEQQTLGYTLITIITTNGDVERALLKVISHYSSSQVIGLNNLSLRGGHGEGTWVGGVSVHIRSAPDQPLNLASLSDMVLTYDADLVGARLAHALLAIPFDCNPAILHLSTIGTPEHDFLNYFLTYARRMRLNLDHLHHEVVLTQPNNQLWELLEKEATVHTDEEFAIWNDSIAQQVVQWFIHETDIDYRYRPLMFPTDVPKKYLQPPQSDD